MRYAMLFAGDDGVPGNRRLSCRTLRDRLRDLSSCRSSIASEPHIAHAAPVARKIVERVQSIKMIDRQIRNFVWWSESDIYSHASAAFLVES